MNRTARNSENWLPDPAEITRNSIDLYCSCNAYHIPDKINRSNAGFKQSEYYLVNVENTDFFFIDVTHAQIFC